MLFRTNLRIVLRNLRKRSLFRVIKLSGPGGSPGRLPGITPLVACTTHKSSLRINYHVEKLF